MEHLFRIIITLACIIKLFSTESVSDPIVQLRNGKIRGRDHGHYLSFESIPYAEPPVGENRFEPPKPFTESWSNIRDATKPPVKCLQWDQYLFREDLLDGEEDCLTVNVYTPSITGNRTYPVLVLIHGGAFMFGTSLSNRHDYIMNRGNAIVVKMQYRLGPLGFLSTEDDVISGNFGLKDQWLALEWIKENVELFNGNPKNISLIGFSAGASSVHFHMMKKELEKLATTAISFSGTVFCPWALVRSPLKRTVALANYLGCSTEHSTIIKACLKQKEAKDIVRAVKIFLHFKYNPFTTFGPVIESKAVQNPFLSDEPEEIIRTGKSAAIPWLASHAKDDGGYNAGELMEKDENGTELIKVLNERWLELAPINLFYDQTVDPDKLEAYSKNLRERYLGDKRFSVENYQLVQNMYTDVLFSAGVEKALLLHKEYTKSPVYAYVYDYPAPNGIGNTLAHRDDINFGTVHGDDFFLIFNRREVLSSDEQVVSAYFLQMIEDFAETGILHFGQCKFEENNASAKGLLVLKITKDGCSTINVDTLLYKKGLV